MNFMDKIKATINKGTIKLSGKKSKDVSILKEYLQDIDVDFCCGDLSLILEEHEIKYVGGSWQSHNQAIASLAEKVEEERRRLSELEELKERFKESEGKPATDRLNILLELKPYHELMELPESRSYEWEEEDLQDQIKLDGLWKRFKESEGKPATDRLNILLEIEENTYDSDTDDGYL